MPGDGVSASERTFEAVKSVAAAIEKLEGDLEEMLKMGSNLVYDGPGGLFSPAALDFQGNWDGRIRSSINDSIESLNQINKNAHISAENIFGAGGA